LFRKRIGFFAFFVIGFLCVWFLKSEKREIKLPKKSANQTKKIKRSPHILPTPVDSASILVPLNVENEDEDSVRDIEEWQGMKVPTIQPHCSSEDGCGLAMACIDNKCVPCEEDPDCATGEACILQHCVPEENGACRTRRDCEEGALCVLSGYSFGARGNSEMKAFCRLSASGEEQVEDKAERKKFDEVRGPYQAPSLEFSDLAKGLEYEE